MEKKRKRKFINGLLIKGLLAGIIKSNDLIITYQLNYGKAIGQVADNFLMNASGTAGAGSLQTKAGAGLNLMAGVFHSPFSLPDIGKRKKIKLYFYNQALVNVVGYDATLQGGLFNRSRSWVEYFRLSRHANMIQ